jgi:chaperonin GroES
MKTKVRPLHDRVIVKRLEEQEKTKGGIIIPDTAKEKPIEGKIIAVGAGKVMENGKRMPLQVKEGDRILFGKYAGTDIRIEGEERLIMREDDIIAIVE